LTQITGIDSNLSFNDDFHLKINPFHIFHDLIFNKSTELSGFLPQRCFNNLELPKEERQNDKDHGILEKLTLKIISSQTPHSPASSTPGSRRTPAVSWKSASATTLSLRDLREGKERKEVEICDEENMIIRIKNLEC
jgi:hypothetical protein